MLYGVHAIALSYANETMCYIICIHDFTTDLRHKYRDLDSWGVKYWVYNKRGVTSSSGRYGGITVIPRSVNSLILIPKHLLLYDIIVIDKYTINDTRIQVKNGSAAHSYVSCELLVDCRK